MFKQSGTIMKMQFYPSKSAEKELIEMFNKDNIFNVSQGTAFIWTSVFDKDGQGYGSYKTVRQVDLHGRRYIVERWDGKPTITLLDTIFNPKENYKAAYHKLTTWEKRVRLRYKRYNRGKLSIMDII